MDFKIRYLLKTIKEIKNTDEKVLLVGEVQNPTENSFFLSDDTGRVEIFSEEIIESKKIMRVFCSITEGQLKLDFFQDLSGADLNTSKKVGELYKRVGV